MGHAIIFLDYTGLPGTDDPNIGGKVAFSKKINMWFRPKLKWFPMDQMYIMRISTNLCIC